MYLVLSLGGVTAVVTVKCATPNNYPADQCYNTPKILSLTVFSLLQFLTFSPHFWLTALGHSICSFLLCLPDYISLLLFSQFCTFPSVTCISPLLLTFFFHPFPRTSLGRMGEMRQTWQGGWCLWAEVESHRVNMPGQPEVSCTCGERVCVQTVLR